MSTDQARPSAVDAAAGARAARLLGWAGVVLPPMTLFGVGVLPAVVLNVDAHEARQAAGDGPQLDTTRSRCGSGPSPARMPRRRWWPCPGC